MNAKSRELIFTAQEDLPDQERDNCMRCGKDNYLCRCFTTADFYRLDENGFCQPDPES